MGTLVRRNPVVVLVVEDDSLLRMDATQMMEEAGFTVLEADNADQAIALLERRSDINVVFTDIQMPGSMDGFKLAHAIRDRWPPVKIIATSGYFLEMASNLPEGGRFISKPYEIQHVAALIREMTNT
jgi:CheY-like chemotaxis protein